MSISNKIFLASKCEEYWALDEYSTIEEVIEHGPSDLGLLPGDSFYVGVQVKPNIDFTGDFDSFFERMVCRNDLQLGEFSERWENEFSENKDIRKMFEIKMKELAQFCEKVCPPNYFLVEEIECITYE